MNKGDVIQRMCETGVPPVFRTADVRHLIPASKAFRAAGVGCVEYTLTMPDALQLVNEAAASFPADLLIGAGTAMDRRDRRPGRRGRAQFIASPGVPGMVEACQRHGVVSVVGAITPTEIMEVLPPGSRRDRGLPGDDRRPWLLRRGAGPDPAST